MGFDKPIADSLLIYYEFVQILRTKYFSDVAGDVFCCNIRKLHHDHSLKSDHVFLVVDLSALGFLFFMFESIQS